MNSITPPPTEALAQAVIKGLESVKAQNVISLDLRPLTHSIASTFVIASASSRTQVEALARAVEVETMSTFNERPWGVHGLRSGEWVILDYSDVVVHIFHNEARAHYALEELWGDAPVHRHSND
ncbi:MAG: ribosome silencing factor [Bacteroidota bacterium]|jgi:ribosome-associated protein|nr:ribosome silencing factor [Bacteroidota bacterium]